MKTLLNKKIQWMFFLLAFVAFSCQDQAVDELSKNQPATEKSFDEDRFGHSRHNVYVLVAGAWHPESSWKDVKFILERCGHVVKTVELPGLGKDQTPVETVTFTDHVNAVKAVLEKQWKPVILVGHGYGGAVITQAGEDLPDKVKKLVFLSGIMPLNGETVADLALADTASLVTKNLLVDGAVAYMTDENYEKAIFNQAIKNPFTAWKARWVIGQLRPHPLATLFQPVQLTANYDGLSKVYISCLKDRAATPEAQRNMFSRVPGVKVYYIRDADHGSAVTTPYQVSEILRRQ